MQGKLCGPVLGRLPNAALIERIGQSASPAGGIAVPWRRGQLVFVCDGARVADPPTSMAALADWAAAHPGRLTHPTARSWPGAAFLAQALVECAPDREALRRPAGTAFARVTAPLWDWYAALRPRLWRRGTAFPADGTAQRMLLGAGEVDIMVSCNPSEARAGVANGTLPATAQAFGLAGGTIGTCSFNVIPITAANPAQALVLANFLLSPEAQAHAADPRILGSPTVLALDRLAEAERARFAAPVDVGVALRQPHPSWTTRLAACWEERFAPGVRGTAA